MERAGVIIGPIKRKVRLSLRISGAKVATYIADFMYTTRQAALVIEDAKGLQTPAYRLKAKLLAALYGQAILET
jgi:Protein of unknown function (DUF1064)